MCGIWSRSETGIAAHVLELKVVGRRKGVIAMAQVKHYKARKDFTLDCGHTVKTGEEFVVTKSFTCAQDAKRLKFPGFQGYEKKSEAQAKPE